MALTANQKLFCEEYVANGYQKKKAYQAAYPNCTTDAAAGTGAWKVLKRPEVKEYIKEIQHDRFEALNINADRIAEELSKMAFADFDENNTANSKQKALELLGKQLGLYTQKVEANVNAKTDITINIEE